ncbi:hypothetical protein DEIPH_ctg018orf0004 [Deinococcus phoenicis]|uniref:Uncharacterized protein n=1 Tax=Deinococcus phoenicis TaxID=1476583 RepID=A0A016QRE6_9DEIO|nr:hypothetical protein DEIPH_ctg018orf0004 [Deinococcus phoenicis]
MTLAVTFNAAALSAPAFAQAVQQVPGAKCSTVQIDDSGTLTVQASGQTASLNAPYTFKCGTLKVTDNGRILNVSGKTLREALSVFPAGSAFGQVWGLYAVDLRQPGVLSITDTSDGTKPGTALLREMKSAIGDASATFTQPGGVSGWVFRDARTQTARYNVNKPLTLTIKASESTPPWTAITLDAGKGTLRAVRSGS